MNKRQLMELLANVPDDAIIAVDVWQEDRQTYIDRGVKETYFAEKYNIFTIVAHDKLSSLDKG